jgi:tRNA nucleotidyltransferase/poly(A) polymerase
MTIIPDFPNPQRRAIELVREVAIEKGCRPFLVGGPVRDFLLGRNAFDIDITVEEDSSTLARALAKRLNGRVRSFPQFLTYKVSAESMPEIDIATARKERYRKPGALPVVTSGRLKDDLLRRDFSINAIAIDLIDGTQHDPTNGVEDIEKRQVRILHDASFIDDPTRIFRAVRLATRLGFTIEAKTHELMRAAIAGGALETISRERIWRELFLAMDEESPAPVLHALRAEGALDVLFGPADEPLDRDSLERIHQQIANDADADRYVLYTGAILRDADDATPSQLEGSGFSQKRARSVLQIANDLPRIENALQDAKSERQCFRLFKRVGPEVLTALVARNPRERTLVDRYREFSKFTIPVRGNDLEVPGGPHVARALERTREAVFTGEVPADAARGFARELALKYLSHTQPVETKQETPAG